LYLYLTLNDETFWWFDHRHSQWIFSAVLPAKLNSGSLNFNITSFII